MRASSAALVVLALLVTIGCADDEVDADVALGQTYVEDPDFRRASLEASLVNPDNGYSRLRLARYTADGWGALPTWTPAGFEDVDSVPWERDALLRLGERAFFFYPMQLLPALERGLEDPDAYGVEAGLVRVRTDSGDATALTCAACHAGVSDGVVVPGLNNADFDFHGILLASRGLPRGPSWWGPGRVDVTPDDIDNPTAIPDLRPVRYQTHLHRAATVRNGLVELAIRTETLIITSMNENHRPPRKLVFALALYLWHLAPEPPTGRPAAFDSACGGCHGSDGLAGPPVPLQAVGTPDGVGTSPARTTGMWRVPSLVGVGERRALTATGDVPDLAALLDPRRSGGHTFGGELTDLQRAEIQRFLDGSAP